MQEDTISMQKDALLVCMKSEEIQNGNNYAVKPYYYHRYFRRNNMHT